MKTEKETVVKTGQWWEETDKRYSPEWLKQSRFKVIEFTEDGRVVVYRPRSRRYNKIRLDRFKYRNTGYRLVESGPNGDENHTPIQTLVFPGREDKRCFV